MPIFDAEAAEGAIQTATSTEQALILLLLAIPLAGFLLTGMLGRRMGRRPWIIAVAFILVAAAIATYLAFRSLSGAYGEYGIDFTLYTWIPAGSIQIEAGFLVDNLTAVLLI